mgnify:CR=1 FL=1
MWQEEKFSHQDLTAADPVLPAVLSAVLPVLPEVSSVYPAVHPGNLTGCLSHPVRSAAPGSLPYTATGEQSYRLVL